MDDERRLLLAANGAMGTVGFLAGSLGPSLSTIAGETDVSLDTAGLLITALAAGGVTASGAVTLGLHRLSQRRLAALGMAVMAAGMLALAFFAAWWALLAAAVTIGAAAGLADAAAHGLCTRATRPAVAVAQLNVAFALGAIAGPAWAGVILQFLEWRWAVFAGGALIALVVAVSLHTAPEPLPRLNAPENDVRFGRVPLIALAMGGLLFFYVGGEAGLGAWTTAFTRRAADTSLLAGALVTSGYWAALFFGRVANGMAVEREREPGAILLISIAGAGLGSLLLIFGGHIFVLGAIGALITGFFFGPIWPSAMAVAVRSGNDATPAMLVTIGNGGGIVLPWLQGRILVEAGTRAGMGMTAALCVSMFAIALAAARRR